MARTTLELRIESLAAGGDGVAHDPQGRVLFVPLTAPGDLVRVHVRVSRKRFARGEVLEILEPGPSRTKPGCSAFPTCGGCAWQHVAYSEQVAAKATIVAEALERIGRLGVTEVPITASPSVWGYRNRARLVQEGDGLGYRMRRSHSVCVVKKCPVLEPELEAALSRELPPWEGEEPREWEIVTGSGGSVRARPVDDEVLPGVDAVEMQVGDDRLRISQGVFAQGNAGLLAPLAQAVVREATGADASTSALELYAGAGLFTLGLARHFDCVWAVESHPGAVADLRVNLERSGATNVDVREGSVEEVLPRLQVHAPDTLVLDPPRAGVSSEALERIQELQARRVVYLSCDPATLARDLGRLRDGGYQLQHVEAFDLFPHTPHVEALATLTLE
jgi:23S rRNA (uracil1939-C5)-methyltransferase